MGLDGDILASGGLDETSGTDLGWGGATPTIPVKPGEDLWVFGYGSLMWNPGFRIWSRATRCSTAITGDSASIRIAIAAHRKNRAGARSRPRRLVPRCRIPGSGRGCAGHAHLSLGPRDGHRHLQARPAAVAAARRRGPGLLLRDRSPPQAILRQISLWRTPPPISVRATASAARTANTCSTRSATSTNSASPTARCTSWPIWFMQRWTGDAGLGSAVASRPPQMSGIACDAGSEMLGR